MIKNNICQYVSNSSKDRHLGPISYSTTLLTQTLHMQFIPKLLPGHGLQWVTMPAVTSPSHKRGNHRYCVRFRIVEWWGHPHMNKEDGGIKNHMPFKYCFYLFRETNIGYDLLYSKILHSLAMLLEHVNNNFLKVNFKNLILFIFVLVHSWKLEENVGNNEYNIHVFLKFLSKKFLCYGF